MPGRPTPRDESTDSELPVAARTRTLRQFRIVFNAVRRHFQQMEHEAGVSGTQAWALHAVGQRPGIGVNDLARAMDVRQPTASSYVRCLSERGLLEVRRESADRRAVQLHLTAAGRTVLRRVPAPFTGVLPDALAKMSAPSLAALEVALDELITILEADDQAGRTPLAEL